VPDYELTADASWTYLTDIFGLPKVPVEVADLLREVVRKLVADDVISAKAKWQALEVMAVNMLGLDRPALALGNRARRAVDGALSTGEPQTLTVQTPTGSVHLVAVPDS
jgi:spore maturation protein SpmA